MTIGCRLLFGERAALDAGGCVVRLVGLYHSLRGAHTFFLRAGQVDRWGGYTINLIHYEDAASLCLAVRKKNYIFCYAKDLTRQTCKFSGLIFVKK